LRRFEISVSSRECRDTCADTPACAVRQRRCCGATAARIRIDGTGKCAGRWFWL